MARNGTTPAEAIQLATEEINNHAWLIEQIKLAIFSKYPQLVEDASLNWEYTLDDSSSTITLTKYIGDNPDVKVQNYYAADGRTYNNVVISKTVIDYNSGEILSYGAFAENSYIESVTFGNNVKAEDNDAASMFFLNANLTEVFNIPNGVTNMDYTFYGCESLEKAPVIPNNVTNMEGTFCYCPSLTKAPVIPESVTNMNYTFWNCESLTKAPVIPESVTNMIGTFTYCYSLTDDLVINANPTSYEELFAYCSINPGTDLVLRGSSTMLEDLLATKSDDSNIRIIPAPTDWEYTLDNIANTITLTKYIGTNPDVNVYDSYEVDDKVYSTVIGSSTISTGVFVNNTTIASVTFDSGVVVEDNNAGYMFYGCDSLEKAPVIPNSVTNMDYTFAGCESLTGNLVINANPTSYTDTFYNCSTNVGTDLLLIGSSTMLETLLATKSSNSNIRVSAPLSEVLIDFDYTENSDGTATITSWKGTLNGVTSTELVVPDDFRIIL